MPASERLVLVSALLAVVTAVAAMAGAVLARGSTAVPAAVWATVAAVAVGLEMAARRAGWLEPTATGAAVRLVVIALMTCPAMSLLGAKRPQHGVWQFIVLALGTTLALPALSTLLVRPGTPPDVHLLGRSFMVLLLFVGWLNFVATRHGVAATLVASGQALLARPFMPGFGPEVERPGVDCIAAGLAAAGAVISLLQSTLAARRRGRPAGSAERIDAAFMAIRETFGAAWALRIGERFDAIAVHRGWPCRLTFRGLRIDAGGDGTEWQGEAERTFRTLARRFVDAAWLSRHGGDACHVDHQGDVE